MYLLRIQVFPKNPGFPLWSYFKDGIGTLNPNLGRGIDILELPPMQDSSHHRDYSIFRIRNPYLNLLLWLASWVGGKPVSLFYMHGIDLQVKLLIILSLSWMVVESRDPDNMFKIHKSNELHFWWLPRGTRVHRKYPANPLAKKKLLKHKHSRCQFSPWQGMDAIPGRHCMPYMNWRF